MLDTFTPYKAPRGGPDALDLLFPLRISSLTYEVGGRCIIDCLNLKISEPGLTMLMGPNGAGKSILLKLMHGLILPTAGDISYAGHRLTRDIARRQAMVFQRPVLLRRTVAANVRHALRLRGVTGRRLGEKVSRALDLAGLEHHANTPARVLSGGEQQRLSVARALSLEPAMLFLDEPTANLDPGSTFAIERLVESHSKATKIIMVTHDVGAARRLAKEIIFLHHGRVLERQSAVRFFAGPDSAPARAFIAGDLVL